MLTSLMPNPKQQYFSSIGIPLSGGKVYTYASGTSTPKQTYSDVDGTIPQSNPIVLNARGEPASAIYWSGAYRVEVRDAFDSLIYTVDNYNSGLLDILSRFATSVGASLIGFIQSGVGAVLRSIQDELRMRVHVKQFGAKGDWDGTTGTDDAPAFQAAIDYVASIGGGTVYVPAVAKAYRLNSSIVVKKNVSLVGDTGRNFMNFIQSSIDGYYGRHCLAITWGANTTIGMAVEMRPNTTVQGLNFIYPGQVTSLLSAAPVPFPPTIAGYEGTCPGGSIVNCNFPNSYKAIYFPYGHGQLQLRGIWGTPMGDFITLNGIYNADQFIDVNVSGTFYLSQSADANFTNNTGLLAWIQKYGKGFVIGYADAIRFTDCFIGNCGVGLYFGDAPKPGGSSSLTQFAYGDWVGGGMEGVTFCIQVVGSASGGINSNGFRFSNVGFAPVGLFNADRSLTLLLSQFSSSFDDALSERAKVMFGNCSFWGSGNWQPNVGKLEGVVDATGGDVSFTGCSFKAFQTYVARSVTGSASFKFANCDFIDRRALTGNLYHFITGTGSVTRFFLGGGNDFKGYFGANFPSDSAPYMYETSQPYSFTPSDIASVDPLPIPAIGRSFNVTGSVSFANIRFPFKDRVITLRFVNSVTIIDGGNLLLAGSFAATPDDTLTLIGDGTNWVETGRSAN